ncbi:hypothetical protein NPIL_525391 [Nephila pilipes]|uniref:Uncharacterized protein n=1 Tax=Nephila pilipes TaxID=299642 RepID=A0A8X6NP79_NEPPI|nr:hypothetical protein NPIL_525391 [Nephila pilipes]
MLSIDGFLREAQSGFNNSTPIENCSMNPLGIVPDFSMTLISTASSNQALFPNTTSTSTITPHALPSRGVGNLNVLVLPSL